MTLRSISPIGLALILITSTGVGEDKAQEATALIEHAKQISDIRVEGAPAYRLKLHLKVFKRDGSTVEGEYSEVWVSKTQWRRETVLGDFHRTEVATGRKRWVLDSAAAVPERAGEIPAIYAIDKFGVEAGKLKKVSDSKINVKGLSVSCLEADNGPLGGKSALCFDNSNGTLVVEVTPFRTATRIADKTCYLADYQKFGDRLFARSYECDEDRRPRLEANVVELVAEPAPDPALFAPLEGAKELVNCLTVIKPPRAVRQAEPIGPGPGHGPVLVVMSVVVGVDGKPHDVRVTSDPQPDFDRASLKAVRQWTFNPATCNGEPIETEIAIETSFVSF